MIIAVATVHTSGINWESVATIITAIIVVSTAITGYVGRQITHAVTDLGDRLEAKLETKETVARIDTRLTVLEATMRRLKRDPLLPAALPGIRSHV